MIVHLVTDSRSLAPGADVRRATQCLLRQAAFAAAAGVDVLQIRERLFEGRDLAALVADVVRLARPHGMRVVVNDRVDVALAAGADGVHLREDSVSVAAARRIAPAGFVVGRSVHTATPDAADIAGADYLIAGTVWPTRSKPSGHPRLGLEGLRALASAVAVPVLAIGGVSLDRADEVARTGAAGIAAISLFQGEPLDGCGAIDLSACVEQLRRSFDTLRSAS